jgi:cytochrome P450
MDFDGVYGEAALDDPHAVFAWMRENRPLHQDVIQGGGKVLIPTRYADVRELLADSRLLRSFAVEDPDAFQGHIGNSDPPKHTRLRKLTGKALTPKRIEQLRPVVVGIVDELLDQLPDEVDLIDDYTHPVAARALIELLGVAADDRELFRKCWDDMASFVDIADFAVFQAATERLQEYFGRAFTDREAPDDLMTALVNARIGEERLTHAELVQTGVFLVIASNKTVSAMLGNTLFALLTNPSQWELLRERPELLPNAVEEGLRYEAPVNLTNPVRVAEPMRVGDLELLPGDLVQPSLTGANRDPDRFADPDTVDITRRVGGHVSFGHGIHFCLGAQLSRLIGEVAIGRLVTRFPGVHLAGDPRWAREHVMRRLLTLPVRLKTGENR